MEKNAQGSVAVVALLVVVLIGLVVGYVAFSGTMPGVTTRQAEGGEESLPGELGTGEESPAPLQNTTIAKIPSKNVSGMSANLTATYYPSDGSFRFVCDTTGFSPTAYTWDFGDGSKETLSTSKDVFYQYDMPGRYRVMCSAADAKDMVTANITIEAVQI